MMRAALYRRKGPANSVLENVDLPEPEPGAHEVRVRVAVSGVNPSDTKNRGGWGRFTEMEHPFVVPHNDGAGVIDRVAPGGDPARNGQRVWIYEAQRDGRALGTAAEFVVVPEQNAVPLPDGASLELGATLGVPAMTAHRCLFMDGGIQGRTVLVQGGGGAVGHAAIQLAKWAGARVLSTASRSEQLEAARRAGADVVIDRKREDVAKRVLAETAGAGVDRIVEVAFEDNIETDLRVLKTGGVIATYASGAADAAPAIPFYRLVFGGVTIHFVLVYAMDRQAHANAVRDITSALEAGALRPFVGLRVNLDQVAAAHEAQDSGDVVGNVVVRIADLEN